MLKPITLLILSAATIEGYDLLNLFNPQNQPFVSDILNRFRTDSDTLALIKDDQDLFCTAVVVDSRAFLVPASCLESQKLNLNKLKGIAENSNSWGDHRIRDVVIHPEYKSGETGFDIALLYTELTYYWSGRESKIGAYFPNKEAYAASLLNLDRKFEKTEFSTVVTTPSNDCTSGKNVGCAYLFNEDEYCPSHFGGAVFDKGSLGLVGFFPYKPQENCSSAFTRTDVLEKWVQEEIAKQENFSKAK